ncbi:MAG: hypothetical protein OEY19_07295 [Gammaproteobacteria bacterium]|nr:hypothetical protein [Gammaproteobacteria bacterium]MDH5631199.1 hypothetical protein [Gammaproteobacteria bacterium]
MKKLVTLLLLFSSAVKAASLEDVIKDMRQYDQQKLINALSIKRYKLIEGEGKSEHFLQVCGNNQLFSFTLEMVARELIRAVIITPNLTCKTDNPAFQHKEYLGLYIGQDENDAKKVLGSNVKVYKKLHSHGEESFSFDYYMVKSEFIEIDLTTKEGFEVLIKEGVFSPDVEQSPVELADKYTSTTAFVENKKVNRITFSSGFSF